MSHEKMAFAGDQEARQKVLHRHVEQSGKFTPQSTAEEVATVLASDIAGKTVIVTGVSPKGLGAEAARVIFKHDPKLLILASRSKTTIDETITVIGAATALNVKAVEVDLADLDSVREAAAQILKLTTVVDVLINNAAIMMLPEFTKTKHGTEKQFGTNHLGHFLLTNLIMQALLRSPTGAGVVNVSSAGHRASPIRFEDINFNDGQSYESFQAYGQSKTANILFSVSLSEKLRKRGLRSFAVDPGSIGTTGIARDISMETRVAMGFANADGTLADNIPWGTVGTGASSYIVTAFDQTLAEHTGKCFAANSVDTATEAYAQDPEAAEKLWVLSEKLVGQNFRYD